MEMCFILSWRVDVTDENARRDNCFGLSLCFFSSFFMSKAYSRELLTWIFLEHKAFIVISFKNGLWIFLIKMWVWKWIVKGKNTESSLLSNMKKLIISISRFSFMQNDEEINMNYKFYKWMIILNLLVCKQNEIIIKNNKNIINEN